MRIFAPRESSQAGVVAAPLRAALVALVSLCVGLSLAGCVQTGDFGRPRATLWNDLVVTPAGSLSAQLRGEPVSAFVYTDDEQVLRDRAWRFLMPIHERSWFERELAEHLTP